MEENKIFGLYDAEEGETGERDLKTPKALLSLEPLDFPFKNFFYVDKDMKSLIFPLDSFNLGMFLDVEKYSGIDDLIIFNNVEVKKIVNVQFLDSKSLVIFKNNGLMEIHTIPNLKDRVIVDGIFKNTKSSLVKIFDIGLVLAFSSSLTSEITNVAVKRNYDYQSKFEEEYYILFTEYSNTKDKVNSISLYTLKKPILRNQKDDLQNLKSRIKLLHVCRYKPKSNFLYFSVFNFEFSFLNFPIFITVEEKRKRRVNIYAIEDYKIILINQVSNFYEGYLAEESVVADFYGQRKFTSDSSIDEGSYFALLNKTGTISLLEIFQRKPIDNGEKVEMRGILDGSVDILDDFIDFGKGSKVFVTFDSDLGAGNFFGDSEENKKKLESKEDVSIIDQIEETIVIKSEKIVVKKSCEEIKKNYVVSERVENINDKKLKMSREQQDKINSFNKSKEVDLISSEDDKFAFEFFNGGCSNLLTFCDHDSSIDSVEEICEKSMVINEKIEKSVPKNLKD